MELDRRQSEDAPKKRKRTATWKHGERQVSRHLTELGMGESERIPVTGRVRGSAPDIKNPRFSIEQKHRKKLPKLVTDAFDQAIKSIRGDQVPIVILHEHGAQYLDSLVVVRLRDLPELFPPIPTTECTSERQTVRADAAADPGDLRAIG